MAAAAEVPLHEIPERCAEIFYALVAREPSRPHFNYFCPDTETMPAEVGAGAYNPEKCLITQVGCASVTDGLIEPNNPYSINVNWIGHRGVPDERTMEELIEKLRQEIEFKKGIPTGKKYTVTMERIRSGRLPYDVMNEVYQFTDKRVRDGYYLVGYNMLRFDIPSMFNNFMRAGVPVDQNTMNHLFDACQNNSWDMGLIVKAAACKMAPWPGETRLAFFQRVDKMFAKVKWSQDGVAIPAFNITAQHGIDAKEAHDAAIDCLIPHLIYKRVREICNV